MAFLYRRRSSTAVPEADLVMAASMDLRWFPHTGARQLLAAAEAAGLVVREGETLRIAFDPSGVDLPLDYQPPQDLLANLPAPTDGELFEEILAAIASTEGLEAKAALARVNEKQERQDVEVEVAALLVLAELGGDPRRFAPRVRDRLLRR